MLGFDRRAARYAWTVALIVLLLVLFYLVRRTLFVFILAILFAYLLSPLVNFLDRVLPASSTRAPALAIAYMLVVGILVVAVIQVGERVVEQANALGRTIPGLLAKWVEPSPEAATAASSLKEQILDKIREQILAGTNELLSQLPKAGLKVLSLAGNLIFVVIVPILSFYFLRDGRHIRDQVVELFADSPSRGMLEEIVSDMNLLLAQYMRALLVLSTATFISYSIFLSVMGLRYGILLAAMAFALEFIPTIGPLGASVIILTVAALNGAHLLVLLLFLVFYRLFQDYVLAPYVMGGGVELHPLWVLFGVFAGAEVAGIAGAFLSVPLLALVRIFYLRLRKSRTGITPASTL